MCARMHRAWFLRMRVNSESKINLSVSYREMMHRALIYASIRARINACARAHLRPLLLPLALAFSPLAVSASARARSPRARSLPLLSPLPVAPVCGTTPYTIGSRLFDFRVCVWTPLLSDSVLSTTRLFMRLVIENHVRRTGTPRCPKTMLASFRWSSQ